MESLSEPTASSKIRLTELANGSSGRVCELDGEPQVCQRLREMGLGESAVVEKVSGEHTVLCELCGVRIALSDRAAKHIVVQPLPAKTSPSAPSMDAKLSELRIGAIAVVRDLPKQGSVFLRLREMGLLPGTPFRLIRTAPMGDPYEIKVRGYNLTLRKSDADQISVTVTDPA